MSGRFLAVGLTLLASLSGCGPMAANPLPVGQQAAIQGHTLRTAAWAITPVETAPAAVFATLDREKDAVLAEIKQAEHLKSVTLSPQRSIRQWRLGGETVGYVVTLHGNVVFDVPNFQKTGAFIVDFCIDPQGNDFGGVYAFTVKSERPISQLLPARHHRDGVSSLSLTRVATKPTVIQAAIERLQGIQQDAIARQYPGLRISSLKAFQGAVAVRHGERVIGYIDTQTTSALPSGDVLGIQVLNYFDPAGNRLFGEARAASASDPDSFRTIRL